MFHITKELKQIDIAAFILVDALNVKHFHKKFIFAEHEHAIHKYYKLRKHLGSFKLYTSVYYV